MKTDYKNKNVICEGCEICCDHDCPHSKQHEHVSNCNLKCGGIEKNVHCTEKKLRQIKLKKIYDSNL